MSGLGTRISQFYLLAFIATVPLFLLIIIDGLLNPNDVIFDLLRVVFSAVLVWSIFKADLSARFHRALGGIRPRQEKIVLASGLLFVVSAARNAIDVDTSTGFMMALAVAAAVVLVGVGFILIVFDK